MKVCATKMGGYAKLSSHILNSSIWSEPDNVRIVWVTMLVMSDAAGFVESSLSGLAHQARKSIPETEAALTVLSSPDPDSKNPDNEGRRISKVEGGWMILNYVLYRAQQELSDDPQAVATRERVSRYRQRKRDEKRALQTVTHPLHPVTPASAYASASESPNSESLVRPPFTKEEWAAAVKSLQCLQKDADECWNFYDSQKWLKSNGLKIGGDPRSILSSWISNPQRGQYGQKPSGVGTKKGDPNNRNTGTYNRPSDYADYGKRDKTLPNP